MSRTSLRFRLLLGLLVPLTLFPGWVTWIAYALPPTWGMAAIRASRFRVASRRYR